MIARGEACGVGRLRAGVRRRRAEVRPSGTVTCGEGISNRSNIFGESEVRAIGRPVCRTDENSILGIERGLWNPVCLLHRIYISDRPPICGAFTSDRRARNGIDRVDNASLGPD